MKETVEEQVNVFHAVFYNEILLVSLLEQEGN